MKSVFEHSQFVMGGTWVVFLFAIQGSGWTSTGQDYKIRLQNKWLKLLVWGTCSEQSIDYISRQSTCSIFACTGTAVPITP